MAAEPSFPSITPTTARLIRSCAERWGDKTFVVLGDRRISYHDAESESAWLAKGLLASGVGKGTRVALLAPNGPDWVIGWLAITRMGAVAVLLNTYNKAGEQARVLRHSDAQVLLSVDAHLGHDYLARFEEGIAGLAEATHEQLLLEAQPFLRSAWTWGEGRRCWAGPVADLAARGDRVTEGLLQAAESEVTPADPMAIVYSSGSTADPKGAIHTHGAAVRHAHNLWQMRDLADDDVLYTPMPLFWVGGFSFTLIACMHAGATVVFEEQFEPGATLQLIERERITQVMGWPHMAKALVDHPSFKDRDLSSVRYGSMSALLPQHLQADADVPTANSLGMTETLGPHTFANKDPLPDGKDGSFGFSVPGVEHKIVDPVTLEDLPVGATGELWLRGYSLMLGLHKRERADTFTPDGWYRTGDAGHFDEDGHFFFTGRMGDLIKSSGMNVTPRDVELALEAQPEVVMAFVCGIDHPDRGQDVVAAIALSPGERLDESEARARVKAELASYMVPRHIAVFGTQTELPWLDSGKVDRRRLTAILEDRFRGAVMEFDPYSREFFEDPWEMYRWLREEVPCYHNERIGFWAVSRYDDCVEVHRDTATYTSTRGVSLDQLRSAAFSGLAAEGASLIMMDPPAHEKMRKLVNRAFTPRRIAEWEPVVRSVIGGILDELAGVDTFDAVRDISGPFPVEVICEILGVPAADRQQIRHWTDGMLEREIGNPFPTDEGIVGAIAMQEYFLALVADRREHPDDRMIDHLIVAEVERPDGTSERLDDREVVQFVILLAAAGSETVTKLVGNGVMTFAEHPDERRRLQDDPELAGSAVEEVLRWKAPSQYQGRFSLADRDFHGVTLPAGQPVLVVTGAANRDPRAYDEPDRFDIGRPATPLGISFGHGIHFCIGAHLARLEGRIAFTEIYRRWPDLQVDLDSVQFVHMANVAGPSSVPVAAC